MSNWNWLKGYLRPMKWWLCLAIVLGLLDMSLLLGITGIQKWLIDDVFVNGEYEKLTYYLLVFAAFIIGYNLVHLLSFMLNRANEYTLQRKLTVDLMNYLFRMPASKYHNDRVGSIAQRFSGDIHETAWLVGHYIPGGITSIAQVIILSVFISLVNPSLLIGVFALSIAFIFIGKRLASKHKTIAKEVQGARAEVLVHIEEGIASTREIVAFHRQVWELAKYRRSFERFFSKVMDEGKLQNKQLAWSEPFRWGANLIVLAGGAYLAINGEISVGAFVVVYQFASQLLEGLSNSLSFGMSVASKTGSVERLKEFMNDSESRHGIELEEKISNIRFHGVSFRYSEDGADIVNNLNIDIPIGKKVAFVGSSGGGKSTIAQLLLRLYDPTEGEIVINHVPMNEYSIPSWRKKVNLVSQEPYLFPDTIYNNLVMGRDHLNRDDVIRCCRAADIHSYIESLPDSYDTLLGERGVTLSGGQRQRLAIARSLLSDSEVLILDEATSALDLETERHVQHNLDRMRPGKTTIVIAHRMSTVENADIIYVMEKGKVVEIGDHQKLISSDSIYRELVSGSTR